MVTDVASAVPTSSTRANIEDELATVFETPSVPPPVGSIDFLPEQWTAYRDTALRPRFLTGLDETHELRREFMEGASMLGLIGRRKHLLPQQLLMVDFLNLGCRFSGALLPRRSAKTTTVLAWLIGRCVSREDYLCAYAMMTTQKKARDRFLKDVVAVIERVYPDEKTRPVKIVKGNGQERLEFPNGSILQFLGPNGDDFRSDAYDVIVLDEAGESTTEKTDDVLSAAQPTQDTRPGAMLVKIGTAGKFRVGQMLWDELEEGRAGNDRHAIMEYSAEDTLTEDDVADWDLVAELIVGVHPGLTIHGGITPLEAIKDNWKTLKADKFIREYFGVFGMEGGDARLVRMDRWTTLAEKGPVPATPPGRFALAIGVHPDQATACCLAAWRDDAGRAYIGVIDHRRGTRWLPDRAINLSRTYKTPIVHETIGAVLSEVQEIQQSRTKVRLVPQRTKDAITAAALLVKEIDAGNLTHFDQPIMNEAARMVVKRRVGLSGAWAFGPFGRDYSNDITVFETAAMALRYYDEMPKRTYVPEEARGAA